MKLLVFILCLFIFPFLVIAQHKNDYPIQQVPFNKVKVTDGFWHDKLETNARVTLWHNFRLCEETSRIDNFAIAGGLKEGKHIGIFFNDSDVFKAIEGAAYSYALNRDPKVDAYLDSLITLIAEAQEEDGYLYTYRTIDPVKAREKSGEERWSNLAHNHELYNVGHLYEAAVAHFEASGKRTLLDVALKNADLIEREFGPGKIHDVPGHEEIEIGLVKLYRLTGEQKYLDLAEFFIDQRGNPDRSELYGDYCQDHILVTKQDEPVGHAVRACYLYSGMADVAALKNRGDYILALDKIWENASQSKVYFTGGVGARHSGESFGNEYELPNLTAYGETCASIANALWNYRMFLLKGDAKYIDIVERIAYNGFLSGVSLEGDSFFYTNPLECDAEFGFNSGNKVTRQSWFGCACCPPNILRFLPSILGYYYATDEEGIYVNLYGQNHAEISFNGMNITLEQHTQFPWNGDVDILFDLSKSQKFKLKLRIPGWVRNQPYPSDLYTVLNKPKGSFIVSINGVEMSQYNMDHGYLILDRKWKKGDRIQIHLPMDILRVISHENVEDNRGKVALQRGPVVYCAEAVDNNKTIYNLVLPDDSSLKAIYNQDELGGVSIIEGKIDAAIVNKAGNEIRMEKHSFKAIPYYAWSNRGAGEMTVWLPRKISSVKINP
ncbi:glycoside hydrolase family 127 protein [Bacteroidota bacterium]